MSKRLVRIYKNPEGQGDYVNKTKAFLKKAQMGAEVESAPNINTFMQHIYEELSNDMTPEDVFAELIASGINKEMAIQMLDSVVSQMVEAGELNPDNPITKNQKEAEMQQQEQQASEEQQATEEQAQEEPDMATDYFNSYADEKEYTQPDLEFEGGGETDDEDYTDNRAEIFNAYFGNNNTQNNQYQDETGEADVNTTDDDDSTDNPEEYSFLKQSSQYPGLVDYYEAFQPITWDPVDTSQYKKGGSKKSFTKNVLKKLQEGGQEEMNSGIGQGDKFDTLTEDVSSLKQNFINVIKNKANKARLDETYDKMMNSGDQSLINTAQTLAQTRNEQNEIQNSFQTGGYVGEGQPEMFMYGGTDLPFYEADFLPEAKGGDAGKKKKVKYVPNPVLPANTRLRLFNPVFGERKIYSNAPYNALTREVYRDPVDDLTPVARTVHKKGIFGRPKKWTDYYTKGAIPSLTPGQEIKEAYEKAIKKNETENKKTKDNKNKWGFTEEEWDEMSGKERRLERRGGRRLKRQMARGEKMMAEDKAFKPNFIQEQDGYSEQINDASGNKLKMPKLVEITKKLEPELSYEEKIGMNKPEFYKRDTEEEPLVDDLTEEEKAMLDERRAEADAIYQQALLDRAKDQQILNDYNPDNFLQLFPTFENFTEYQNEFLPSESFDKNEDYEFKYGGNKLKKYSIQGAVKSPTGTLSSASDPTANTIDLTNTLKPAENPNTLLGMSLPFMNQNLPVNTEAGNEKPIFMDPNQTKDQKITSLDFSNSDEDPLIAQDFERKRDFNGEAFNTKLNSKVDFFTGIMNRLDANKKQNEMYANNFTADTIYGTSTNKDKGDYVAYGQQTGMFRPNETGNNTMGRFAYGQMGGYMQDGGQQDQREILKKFMATPEFKKGLDKMMSDDKYDNGDPFLEAMTNANYSDDDYNAVQGIMLSDDWQNTIPSQSYYNRQGRRGEYQKIINNLYGSERYVTPYAPGGGGPRREDAPYYPVNEKIGPFEDGRLDPRTLDRPAGNYYTDDEPAPEGGYRHGGYMQSGGYTEGDEVDMTEEELAEFIANGGEVEYLES